MKINGIYIDSTISFNQTIESVFDWEVQTEDNVIHVGDYYNTNRLICVFSPRTTTDYDILWEELKNGEVTIEFPLNSTETEVKTFIVYNRSRNIEKISKINKFSDIQIEFKEKYEG